MSKCSGILLRSLGRIVSAALVTTTSSTRRPGALPSTRSLWSPFLSAPASSCGRSPFGGTLMSMPSIVTRCMTFISSNRTPRSTSKLIFLIENIGGRSRRPLWRKRTPSPSTFANTPRPRLNTACTGENRGTRTRRAASSTSLSNRVCRYEHHLRADIRFDSPGEDIAGHRQRNEHRHRNCSDADEPLLSSCHLM